MSQGRNCFYRVKTPQTLHIHTSPTDVRIQFDIVNGIISQQTSHSHDVYVNRFTKQIKLGKIYGNDGADKTCETYDENISYFSKRSCNYIPKMKKAIKTKMVTTPTNSLLHENVDNLPTIDECDREIKRFFP